MIEHFSSAQSFTYSTAYDESIVSGIEDAGNFYFVGQKGTFSSSLPNFGNYNPLILKVNSLGTIIYSKEINTSSSFATLYNIFKESDSTLIALGTKEDSLGDQQILFVKMDSSLEIISEKTVGADFRDEFITSCKVTLNGEIILTGFTFDSTGDYQVLFYKLNWNGDSLSSFTLGDLNYFERGYDILQLIDTSGYLFFSYGWNGIPLSDFIAIVKTTNTGSIDTIVSIPNSDIPLSAKWVSDSTFVVCSTIHYSTFPIDMDLMTFKYGVGMDSLANYISGSVDTIDIAGLRTLDFIDVNKIYYGGTGNYKNTFFQNEIASFYFVKCNVNLVPNFEKYFTKGNDYLSLNMILATSDGGVLLAGTSYNDTVNGPFERDIYVIKLDSAGNFTAGADETGLQQHEVLVFPNPVHETLTIKAAVQLGNAEVILYDLSGREVLRKEFTRQITVQVNHLAPGMYIYTVTGSSGKEEKGKVIKQ